MAFLRGPQYRVYITLENENCSLVATGTDVFVTSSLYGWGPQGNNGIGIGPRTLMETGSSQCEITNIISIEKNPGWETDAFTVFGQSREIEIPVRKQCTITITRKEEDELFSRLNHGARFGVTGSSNPTIFDGRDTMPSDTGYRIFIYDGAKFFVAYHCIIDDGGYKKTLTPKGTTDEAITFVGGMYEAVLSSASVYMTASRDITQV